VLRVLVKRGEDAPYAVDDNKIYVRDEAETGLAVRDEIVGLVLRGRAELVDTKIEAKADEPSLDKPVVETQTEHHRAPV
jgi:hypothetical protein